MSYADGWAALNLDMPPRVPRTEFSAPMHWELLNAVLGSDLGPNSPREDKAAGSKAFMRAWNFDFDWATGVGRNIFGGLSTSMGHAVYAAGGVDWNEDVQQAFEDPDDVLAFDPWEAFGPRDHAELVAEFERQYQAKSQPDRDWVDMTGIYVSLISGLIDLFGWDMLLLAMGLDPKRFGEMTGRYSTWIQQYFDALAAADVPVVMVHDDMVWSEGPFAHPDWYRTYVFPNFKRQVRPLVEAGKVILFTSDGNFTEFVDDLVDCGVGGFVMEPMTDMRYIAEKYGHSHFFVGNVDTRVLLTGSREQIRAEVARCMAIGKDCPGYFMAVGNHIPPNTPAASALYYNEVYEALSRR